ncbi:MAG: nucleotide-binding protein [Candidatus Bathyarchaeota archaeon]|nr:nucleotide-binding protein [Candidatus Bathyarchaeota archaeon]
MSEKKLVGLILEKHRLREKFACGGELVNPPDVLEMKITKSEKPLGFNHPDFFRLEYRDLWRKFEAQEDVTRRFAKYIPDPISESVQLSKNVFIVHGKDHKPLKELKAMLKGFGLNPIVLHEKASGGLTLAEKLEKHSEDVGYAFVILTPDDIGVSFGELYGQAISNVYEEKDKAMKVAKRILAQSKGDVQRFVEYNQRFVHDPSDVMEFLAVLNPRARQNVIFEMGYFWGLLKRKKVCCLLKGKVEKPSDIEGIVYIPFEKSVSEIENKVIKELEEAGYKIAV